MRRAGQTPHGARPNREGASGSPGMRAGSARHNLRVGRLSRAAMLGPEEWPSRLEQSGGQNSAYRSGCNISFSFNNLLTSNCLSGHNSVHFAQRDAPMARVNITKQIKTA